MGSVFLLTLPLAVVALVLASCSSRATSTRRRIRSTTSAACSPSCSLARDRARSTSRRSRTRARSCSGWRRSRLAALVAFVIRQRAPAIPLYDLDVAGRRVFWVAACAGIIVFGSLMGAMFIGQQFLQNVLGYSTLEAGRGDPAGGGLHGARRAALGEARGRAGRPLHAAPGLRLLPARLPDDAAALERGHRVLEGRRSATR